MVMPAGDLHLLHPSELPPLRDWADSALCAQSDPELWFIDKGGSPRPALAVCATCPVAKLCLEYAIAWERTSVVNVVGIWGGTTAMERKEILRDLPPLCLVCPNERQPNNTYCTPCADRRAEESSRRYERAWRAST